MAVIKCLCIPILKYHSDTLSVSLPVVDDHSANCPFAFQWCSDEDCLNWSGSGSRSLLIESGVLKNPPSLSLMIPDPVRLNIVDSSSSLRSLIVDSPSVSVRAVPPLKTSVSVLDPVVRIVVVSILRNSKCIDSGLSASIGSATVISLEDVSLSLEPFEFFPFLPLPLLLPFRKLLVTNPVSLPFQLPQVPVSFTLPLVEC